MDYGPQQDSANSEQMLWTIVHTEEYRPTLEIIDTNIHKW